ncbi:acetyl-CoA synthetase-like protein [Xylariaceae sp. FL0594]|nr:acetyl-CoA synthetase-like protein [Xylariaceae sp. FL0594]
MASQEVYAIPPGKTTIIGSLPSSPQPALRYSNSKSAITHKNLHTFVRDLSLPIRTSRRGPLPKPIVAIIIPNGPLLAATVIAVSNSYVAAPINPAAGPAQVRADIELSGASAIITHASQVSSLDLESSGLELFLIEEDDKAGIRVQNGASHPSERPAPNQMDDIAMVLFTSGTSGNRKVVPITVGGILHGVQIVVVSWGLTSRDICLNMMPLYHVGGIVRNIFAPVFSGGSTICCPSFDPNLFWDQVEEVQPTWYYASPTMHSMILEEGQNRPSALAKSEIRLVCNAAGSLLPTLADRIKNTFHCTVLPSYGMTECMPISTPPLSYALDRPGTSGVITGPELKIMDGNDKEVPSFVPGRICLRGSPLFHGYLRADGTIDKSPFNPEGWFDSGDIGYLDQDGYLYITGRNKEVINRGGELISPFEVENAIVLAAGREDSPLFGRVSQALAFSVRHETLQEVVGIVLVTPPGQPKVDLRVLHQALRSSLQQVKWPVVVVYMDDVPKRNNKVLRVKLGERLDIPCIDDDTPYPSRHFSAQCPPPETALTVGIPSEPYAITRETAMEQIRRFVPSHLDVHLETQLGTNVLTAYLAPKTLEDVAPDDEDADALKAALFASIDGFFVPHSFNVISKPLPRDAQGVVDQTVLSQLVKESQGSETTTLADSSSAKVTHMFADILQIRTKDVDPTKTFFDLGGDSLRAGKLLSTIRAEFGVRIPIDFIFKQGTVNQLADYIDDELAQRSDDDMEEAGQSSRVLKTYSSTNPILLLIQLLPIMVFYPIKRAFPWTFFMYALTFSQIVHLSGTIPGRLFTIVLSIILARLASGIVMPIVGILMKWLIVGRLKEGLYPMWGVYHTRWWLSEKAVMVFGRGIFNWTDTTLIWYYRLLGAKIGSNVTIKNAQLGEWDLLDIGDNATLDRCVVRAMAGEHNTAMYLGKIKIGRDASIGVSSTVAPGATIPDSACIGARSSSWELRDANAANRNLSQTKAAKAHWVIKLFGVVPLKIVSTFLYNLPWILGLLLLVLPAAQPMRSQLITILHWFTEGERVGWYYLARTLRTFFGPFFVFGFAFVVKTLIHLVWGPLRPSASSERSNVDHWRMALMESILPSRALFEMTHLFGQHYEATSVAIRMMGGKVGKRVYWPGTGPSVDHYELLEVGSDVVFGSRSHMITNDGHGSDYIKIKDGAMIADRVIALPGVTIGEGATMGSGCLTQRDRTYEPQGVYVGSKGGDSVFLGVRGNKDGAGEGESVGKSEKAMDRELAGMSDLGTRQKDYSVKVAEKSYSSSATTSIFEGSDSEVDSSSPFGRAFYQRKAPYFVWRQWMIFLYSALTVVLTTAYWSAASISSMQVVARVFEGTLWLGNGRWFDPFVLFGLCAALLSVILVLQSIIALGIVIGAKWILLGRRKPGNYDWDKSSYCQRWQLFLAIERIRRRCFGRRGVLGMLTGTAYVTWYFRAMGAKIGKDCALFVSGRPSLMFTEPDLIEMGDRVVVDDASLVGHINTRGRFDLNMLHVGDRCVLRSNSRLLSGARMENDSCLLENTLIMAGDIVDEGETMQGWPASRVQGRRL